MAREGISTVEFLRKNVPSATITVTDGKTLADLDPIWREIVGKSVQKIESGQIKLADFDFIFKTPGIPPRVFEKTYHLDQNSPTTSNTQLFFEMINELDQPPTVIGVTGTKGKSTTTSQIYHVLKESGYQVMLGGNIGVPPLRLLEGADQGGAGQEAESQANSRKSDKNIYVLEMSCHQLADLKQSPNISVIQEISPDHLDFYGNFENYFKSKTAICRFQSESDLVIFNQDSQSASKMAMLSQGKKIGFSLKDRELVDFIKSSHTPLLGRHNLYNTMPAVIIARHLGIKNEKISEALATFKAVPHRLELVETVRGVRFYNDSASSAPSATIAAIKAFENSPLILIAGGSEKGVSFAPLAQAILDYNVKQLVLFPITGQKILDAVRSLDGDSSLATSAKMATSMEDAVKIASTSAKKGDTILLSPGSASFNMFKNYEDRGEQFRAAVESL